MKILYHLEFSAKSDCATNISKYPSTIRDIISTTIQFKVLKVILLIAFSMLAVTQSYSQNNYQQNPTSSLDWYNLQSPAIASIFAEQSETVYAQVFKAGFTESEGAAPGIRAWIGIGAVGANPDPSTWTVWFPASYIVDAGNNDEYMAQVSTITAGLYFMASRFQLDDDSYVYGGLNGPWNGITSPSGLLTVLPNPTQCATNLQPANGTLNVPVGYVTLSWSAPSFGPAPVSYDIYRVTDGQPYLQGTSTTTSFTILVPGYASLITWKVVPRSASGVAATYCINSSFLTEANPFSPYCSNVNYPAGVYPISEVRFAGIENVSSNEVTAFPSIENFKNIQGTVSAGESYTMSIRGRTKDDEISYLRVFIDWNRDNDFNDAGETYDAGIIVNSNGVDGESTKTILTIPANAISGATRMRIKKFSSATTGDNACVGSSYGQTEDYMLNVIGCEPTTWYADRDGDGFGTVNYTITSCEQPQGYVANNYDCDDTQASINPLAEEVLYNGVDDNCDGSIDEGAQIVTSIQARFCGRVLSQIDTKIYVIEVPNTTAYRFEVIALSDGNVQYVETPNPFFKLTDMPNFAYGETYNISVQVQRYFAPSNSNIWLGYYGPGCRVSTPVIKNYLKIKECGLTRNIYSPINAYVVQGATGYKFRITDVSNPDPEFEEMEFETNVSWFHLTSLPSYEYNTTYSVQVAIKTTGNYTDYGPACDIYTLPYSALNLNIKQCGVTYTNRYGSINANVIPNVSGYQFRITNLATSVQQEITSNISWITLSQVTPYFAGASYSVEVAVKTTGNFGAYGPACTITTPAAVASNGTVVNADFKVVASPNPFSDTFALEISEGAAANAEVKVYDMIGKLLEVHSVQSADLSLQRLGNSFPAGVYNVVVTQGDAVRTLKVIKR